ncbi:MAG: hypothetical protein HQK72_15460 [Desulfamplus sp.]|nr:hypothetical protein [Desulfamplus sp.]
MLLYYENGNGYKNDVSNKCIEQYSNINLSLADIIEAECEKVDFFDKLDLLINRIQHTVYDIAGIIIVLDNKNELDILLSYKNLFDDIYILLILLGENPAMFTKSLELRPRYIVYWKKEKKEIIAILHNFVRIIKKRNLLTNPNALRHIFMPKNGISNK